MIAVGRKMDLTRKIGNANLFLEIEIKHNEGESKFYYEKAKILRSKPLKLTVANEFEIVAEKDGEVYTRYVEKKKTETETIVDGVKTKTNSEVIKRLDCMQERYRGRIEKGACWIFL